MRHALTFLVVKNVAFELIIGRPTMKIMRTSYNFDKSLATFKSRSKVFTVLLWSDKDHGGQALSKEFRLEEEDSTERSSKNKSYVDDSTDEDAGNKEIIVF